MTGTWFLCHLFFFLLFTFPVCLHHSLHCLSSVHDSLTQFLQFSSLSPSSTPVLMSSRCGRCGVQSFSLTAASPAGFSHGAPNASLEYWINPRTSSVLPDQQHYYYLAITPHGVRGLRQDGWALNMLSVVGEGRDNRHGWVECLKLFDSIPCDYETFPFSFITLWSWLKAPLKSVSFWDASSQDLMGDLTAHV